MGDSCTVVILRQVEPFDNEEDYQQLLKLNFGQVYVQDDPSRALEIAKQSFQSTLLLVDLDVNVQFVHDIARDLPDHIPLIVCSKNESRQFMLDCIHAGATDYLLKPLSSTVIKTLFLKAHKYPNTFLVPQQLPLPSPNPLYERMNEMNSKDSHISKILMDAFTPKNTVIRQPNISKKRSLELESIMSSWDFSPFELTLQEQIHVVYLILNKVLSFPELHFISITKVELYDFIIDLARVYHDENPYHNFAHAVDVLQCLYYMLTQLNVFTKTKSATNKRPQDVLRPKDIFALLIAAIGHDAAHPGVNNMFLINSSNPLATLYNDQSVLESLHSMTLFQLLNKHGILHFFDTAEEYKEFRKIIVSSILATDMAHHLEYVNKIKEFRHTKTGNQETDRILLCCALIKCADISNVARPFRRGAKWAQLLIQEFVCQGDLEKELGMPVLPMNDRNQVVLEDSQIGFIQFVALDLFQNVREILKEISFAVDQMQANLKQWETRKSNTMHDSGVSNLGQDDLSNHSMLLNTGIKSLDGSSFRKNYDQFEYEDYALHKDEGPICCRCLIQ